MIRILRVLQFYLRYMDENDLRDNAYIERSLHQHRLQLYLTFATKFLQDWRDTLIDLYYIVTKTERPESTYSRKRSDLRATRISSAIEGAIKRGYLKQNGMTIKITTEGREFMHPLRFLNACLAEYGHLVSLVLGLIGGAIGKYLVDIFS